MFIVSSIFNRASFNTAVAEAEIGSSLLDHSRSGELYRHRLFLTCSALYLLLCLIGTVLYFSIGRDVLASSFEADSAGFLSHALRNRDANSLEYYYQRAESIITGFWMLAAVFPLVYLTASKGYWLSALLIADFSFMVLSVYAEGPFDIAREWSLPEIYQYGKEFSIVCLFAAAFRVSRFPTLGCLALIFAYLLLDDSLQYHERAGVFFSNTFTSLADGSDAKKRDVGEALALVVPAAVLGIVMLVTYMRDGVEGRRIFRKFLLLLFVLAFCGVFVDLVLKSLVSTAWESILTILEDGGEMVVMSLILANVIRLQVGLSGRDGMLPKTDPSVMKV